MREPYRDPGRLEDILEAAKNVAEFIESVNFQQSSIKRITRRFPGIP